MIKLTLVQGDCLKYLPKIPSESIDAIVTDPPYNVLRGGISKLGLTDNFDWDNITNYEHFTKTWFTECMRVLKEDSCMFIFWSEKHLNLGLEVFKPSKILIWHYKNLTSYVENNFLYDYDFIFLVKKRNPQLKQEKGKKLSSVFEYSKPQSNFKEDTAMHPTQKPLKLVEELIKVSSDVGDVVLDPFLGGGTTMLASLNLKRSCIGIEIDLKYIEISKKRLNWGKRYEVV